MATRQATGGLDTISQFRKTGLQSALSTQIKILAQNCDDAGQPVGSPQVIGAIQSLAPTETRPLIRISEVGTDGVIEIVPNGSTTCEIAVTRMVFDYQRLPAAFQRGFRHIHAARLPFDIVVEDYNAYQEYGGTPPAGGKSQNSFVKTIYKNCWLANYSFTYTQDNFLISETASIWCEHVFDQSASPIDDGISVEPSDTLESGANKDVGANALTEAHAAINRA